ncbi:hypothetical protein PF005_g26120 [Phytophthora fragariae]|uniref:Uncharacterized protein n=1 Tax=Phytophthora fragariae TaxID=53985 RepID=A0A6A3VWU5_9STRA|nr:hypothetical protein PF005_g26120 [Phytophthora fragariae]
MPAPLGAGQARVLARAAPTSATITPADYAPRIGSPYQEPCVDCLKSNDVLFYS